MLKRIMSNWWWWTDAAWSCFFLELFQGTSFKGNNVVLKASRKLLKDCRRDRDELFFCVTRNQRRWKEMGGESTEQAGANEVGRIACVWRQPRTARPRAGGILPSWVLPVISPAARNPQTKVADGKPGLHSNSRQLISNAIYQASLQKWHIMLDAEHPLGLSASSL